MPTVRFPFNYLFLAVCLMLFIAPMNSIAQAPSDEDVIQEVEAVYAQYAADLIAGNREALGNRYSADGHYFTGSGAKTFLEHDVIKSVYTSDTWNPPASFEWVDLSYEVMSPDAVLVVGKYVWGRTSGDDWNFSYVSTVLRQDGEWKIKHEDQSLSIQSALADMCPAEEPVEDGSDGTDERQSEESENF